MRCGVGINVVVVARDHVGGMLNVNKNGDKMRKFENYLPRYSQPPVLLTGIQFSKQAYANVSNNTAATSIPPKWRR